MSYVYQELHGYVFTEPEVKALLRIRDFVDKACGTAGAVRAQEMMSAAGSGDSWEKLALIDYLEETEEIYCIYKSGAWQHRVYTSRRHQ